MYGRIGVTRIDAMDFSQDISEKVSSMTSVDQKM